MPAKNKVTISVRLEPALARRMKKLAKAADRSVSWYIARIIENRIDIEESQIKAILEGEAAADKGQFVDLDEVFADLERKYARKNKRARSA
ncbi:MAG: hypothetical protein ICCCNLDF_00673 [Planctomycetes bacterium]|nr:hypothetical protein [Planctomycetota bacterium]